MLCVKLLSLESKHTVILLKIEKTFLNHPHLHTDLVLISPQWLELPIFRTNFLDPKDIRAIEVRLYMTPLYDFK